MSLSCPKCTSEMRSYERNRVLVDQCTGCGGLFLDRGELEQLSAAENAWHSKHDRPQQTPQDRPYDDRGHDDRGHDDRRYDDRGYDDRGYYDKPYDKKKRKKRESFLSDLFD